MKENITLETLTAECELTRKKVKDFLMANLENFIFDKVYTHYVSYTLKNHEINIWIANGEVYAKFYNHFGGVNLDYDGYTEEEVKKLWQKAQSDIHQSGTTRIIKMTKMSNDLFFSFSGVHKTVNFTGYDDTDWWTKYKPTTIKEDENIIWEIDWDRKVAIYKSIKN